MANTRYIEYFYLLQQISIINGFMRTPKIEAVLRIEL
jgi:hypothetical protein